MYRVLKPEGTLTLNILRSIAFNPAYRVLADALEEYAGTEAATMMRSPFPSWDKTSIRKMVKMGGFEEAEIQIEIISMRYPSPAEFLRREAASSSLAKEIELMDPEMRMKLIDDLNQTLEDYRDDLGVILPMETYMLIAHK